MTVEVQDDILAAMAKRLAEIRLERGLTIEEFAELLGTTPKTLYRIAKGDTVPRFSTMRKFAKALGMEASEIEEFARVTRSPGII